MCTIQYFLQVVRLVYGELTIPDWRCIRGRWPRQFTRNFLKGDRALSHCHPAERSAKSHNKEPARDVGRVIRRALRNLDRARGGLCVLSALLLSRRNMERIIELGSAQSRFS
jgi:hypothetical protein